MAVVAPTVTAFSLTEYRQQLENVQKFATRIHIDFMDGIFTPTVSPGPKQAFWQPGPIVDFHVMHKNPLKELENMIILQPHLIVVHAEAEGILDFLKELDDLGIKKGIALLKDTPVSAIKEVLKSLDHVLIFSGDLGHFGGKVDLGLLNKVKEIKSINPGIEIGWDGGINVENALDLAKGGIDVLNTGGYIQRAENPEDAYDTLVAALKAGGY